MNLIAHIHLAGSNEDWIVGNMVADFIRGKEKFNFTPTEIEGIDIHRFIDYFTDHHVLVEKAIEFIKPVHKKYSPVIMDIFFDYVLTNNWAHFSNESLVDFSKKRYEILERKYDTFPDNLTNLLRHLISEDWIIATSTEDYLRKTMARMDKRTSFPSKFEESVDLLLEHYESITELFIPFYKEMAEGVEDYCYLIEKKK